MRLTFAINADCELLLKKGQKVNFKDPIAKKKTSQEISIPLSSILNVSPSAIFKSLKRFAGEKVKKGEVIAESKGILSKKHYRSEVDGIIKEINHQDGVVIIETDSDEEDTHFAFFKGEVVDIKENEITVEVENYKEFTLKEVSGDFGGEILIITKEDLNSISDEIVKDKIVFTEVASSYEQVKLEALGVKAIVTAYPCDEKAASLFATLNQPQDLGKIKKVEFPYCIVSKENNKIYIYV